MMLSRKLKLGLLSLQWIFLTAGAVVLGSQAWHQVHAEQIRAQAIESILQVDPVADSMPDTTEWSPGRITKWEAGQKDSGLKAKAVLYLPGSDSAIPVFGGMSDPVLDIGAGHLETTPMPGPFGNFVLAGHRDGYFRPLKDVSNGDLIKVSTRWGDTTYQITSTQIVEPDTVSVLEQTSEATITLITCYPFYFVGSAPQRFIVQGTVIDSTDPRLISAKSELLEGGADG